MYSIDMNLEIEKIVKALEPMSSAEIHELLIEVCERFLGPDSPDNLGVREPCKPKDPILVGRQYV